MAWQCGIEERPSPNFGPRRDGAAADMVVLHYTGMETAAAAFARLADSASEVSTHYVICPDGCVVRMVDEAMRAWHAGAACWGGVTDVNSHSVGIELVNPGHQLGYLPFPEPQMAALERMLSGILSRHGIAPERVVGHACVAPERKRDPGEKLDWRRLALRGLSVWLDAADEGGTAAAADAARFQAAARRFGYRVPDTGAWCAPTRAVWRTFAMRFLPATVGSEPSDGGTALLERLAEHWPVLDPTRARA